MDAKNGCTKETWLRAAVGVGAALATGALLAKAREADLRGQVALITGSSRGLGLGLARAFTKEGCRLVICGRDPATLDRARADLVARGAEVFAMACDVSDPAAVDALVEAATERFGRVDIVVNNAGVISVGPVETVTRADFQRAMDIMFFGAVNTIWAVLPQMRARRSGRIVNITSIGGRVSVPHLLPYSAAKFAATGLSEGLRAELAKDGIRVTTVIPGLMRTGSYLRANVKGQKEREFLLFGALDNFPLFSISVDSAIGSIVAATKRGDAEITLSPQAKAMALFHGLFPGAFANIAGLANRFLPSGDGDGPDEEMALRVQERQGGHRLADPMGLGRAAAERMNQYPPPSSP